MKIRNILVLNGPNLNLLGTREPSVYGNLSLDDLESYTTKNLEKFEVKTNWKQSNHEGVLIEEIQNASDNYDAIVINPGAYSHTSVAILDAMRSVTIPIVEVHLSNTHHRESYRQVKLTAKASTIIMEGLGKKAYLTAIWSLLQD